MDTELLTQIVTELLSRLGVSFDSLEVREGHRTIVAITSSEGDLLIGPSGEHLKAINMLARRLVETKQGEHAGGFLVDVNDFHESQLEKVRANARMLAQKARLFKHDVEMDPMSSYERLVIHELFADDPEIQTESAGEGKFRHIVLRARSK